MVKKYSKKFFEKNVLTPITSPIKKYKIAGFDVETHGYKNKYYLGGVYIDSYKSFLDKLDLIQYIEEHAEKDMYFMATNLGFDFQAVYFDTIYWNKFKLIMRNGNTLTASHKKVKFSDTLNYAQFGVKRLGEMIGLPKLVYKEHIGKIPRTRRMLKHLKAYNARDCLISKRATEYFQDAFNTLGCELKLTIASTAMDLFRRRFLKKPIYKEKFDCKDFIYEGYYGGRVECYKRGKLKQWKMNREVPQREYYWYDYNSAYPFQMLKDYPLPSSAKMTTNSSINLIQKYHGCSEVTIECPYMRYPLLPYRMDGKLVFPTGKFTGVYNHIELQRAIELGYTIHKIHKTLYYTQTFKPFYEYVTTLYALRLKYKAEGNLIMSEVCKILMNSLYGKFATKSMQDIEFFDLSKMTDEEIIERDLEGMFDGMQVTEVKKNKITKGYNEHEKECNQNYILPILSSCVTSYQRVQLHKDIVRLKGIYCDTDSILTEEKFDESFELGGLKIEKKVSRGWIIRPKCYMIYDTTLDKKGKEKGWNVKVKGIHGMTPIKFVDVLYNTGIEQIKFMKIKEALKNRYSPNQKKKFKKQQNLEDDKRVWERPFDKNDWIDSEPIHVKE